jgi:hypothetical protein
VILPDRHSAELNGACARAAAGALDIVPLIAVTNLARALERLAAEDITVLGLDAQAPAELAPPPAGHFWPPDAGPAPAPRGRPGSACCSSSARRRPMPPGEDSSRPWPGAASVRQPA